MNYNKGTAMRGNFQKNGIDFGTYWSGKIANLLNRLTTVRDTNKKDGILWFLFISLFICFITLIVYMTGGTNAYVHLMYVPIILSVFIFDKRIAVLIVLFAGIMVGPFMPFNVKEGIMQTPNTWIFRCVMFLVVMLIIQALLGHIRDFNDLEKKKAYEDLFTGYPNLNKWKSDFNCLPANLDCCQMVLFEVINIETIARNVDYYTSQETYKKILELCSGFFKECQVYAVNANRILVSVLEENAEEVYGTVKEFISKSKQPIYINQIPVAVILKAGMVTMSGQEEPIEEVALKMEKALDQACHSQKEVVIYNRVISEEISKHYDMLVAIYHAFNNNEFHLVYQPQIDSKSGRMIGTEALLRWNRNPYQNLSIAEIIKIAEDAEFISTITKWVIKNVISQIKVWENQNKNIRVSVNLSARDLSDDAIMNYTMECIRLYDILPEHLEFELTERSIIEEEGRVFRMLREMQGHGIHISLDDYGTGHNSLLYLVKNLFSFDSIKIEKMFIDHIENPQNQLLIEGIVKTAHKNQMKVIAEGVETKEQYDIVKKIGCDIIQGYYFSKPVLPGELEKMIN